MRDIAIKVGAALAWATALFVLLSYIPPAHSGEAIPDPRQPYETGRGIDPDLSPINRALAVPDCAPYARGQYGDCVIRKAT